MKIQIGSGLPALSWYSFFISLVVGHQLDFRQFWMMVVLQFICIFDVTSKLFFKVKNFIVFFPLLFNPYIPPPWNLNSDILGVCPTHMTIFLLFSIFHFFYNEHLLHLQCNKIKFIFKNMYVCMYVCMYVLGKGGRKRGTEILMWEGNIDGFPPVHAPTGDQTHNLGMCIDWELNQWTFTLWDDVQPSEPHQSGQ